MIKHIKEHGIYAGNIYNDGRSDGAGKTTQIELLKDYLNKKGYDVLITRDPGGNAVSEAIREVIFE